MLIIYCRWEVALAALRSGIVLSPATTLSTDKDIQFRCNKSRASVFVGDAVSVAKFLAVKPSCPSVRTIIQVGDGISDQVISLYSALESVETSAKFRIVNRSWDSIALVYFTSGTSGPPKMVRHNQVSYPLGKQRSIQELGFFLMRKRWKTPADIGINWLQGKQSGTLQSKVSTLLRMT
jgi:acyl-coenzyme A synthetase/AMP-(fatty) acid ligase